MSLIDFMRPLPPPTVIHDVSTAAGRSADVIVQHTLACAQSWVLKRLHAARQLLQRDSTPSLASSTALPPLQHVLDAHTILRHAWVMILLPDAPEIRTSLRHALLSASLAEHVSSRIAIKFHSSSISLLTFLSSLHSVSSATVTDSGPCWPGAILLCGADLLTCRPHAEGCIHHTASDGGEGGESSESRRGRGVYVDERRFAALRAAAVDAALFVTSAQVEACVMTAAGYHKAGVVERGETMDAKAAAMQAAIAAQRVCRCDLIFVHCHASAAGGGEGEAEAVEGASGAEAIM